MVQNQTQTHQIFAYWFTENMRIWQFSVFTLYQMG